MLNVIAVLGMECEMEFVPTFLVAHAIPQEYASDPDAYVSLIIDKMIPMVAAWQAEHWPGPLYCDVFCETGVFTLQQTQRILEAAQPPGLKLRAHPDDFDSLAPPRLAADLLPTSLHHLLHT